MREYEEERHRKWGKGKIKKGQHSKFPWETLRKQVQEWDDYDETDAKVPVFSLWSPWSNDAEDDEEFFFP